MLSLAACSNDETYADELKAEKALIAEYIARHHIKTVETLPNVFPWPDSTYYLSSTGLYFRLEEQGDINAPDSIEYNDLVIPRFIQYTLNENSDTTYNWSTIDFAYNTTFNYGNLNQACDAWHEATSYMKRNNSFAKIIVPSKLGFETDENSVTPYCYDFKMKFQK
jgi:hypothetical protein